MNKIILLIITIGLANFPADATDSKILVIKNKKNNEFSDSLNRLNEFSRDYKKYGKERDENILGAKLFLALQNSAYAVSAVSSALVSGGGTIAIASASAAGSGAVWAYDLGNERLKEKLADGSEKFYNNFVSKQLYILQSRDQKRLEEILNTEDDVERVKALYAEFEKLDAFSEIEPASTQARSVMNSRAIISLITVTKGLTGEVLNNSSQINELREQAEQFNQFISTHKQVFIESMENQAKMEEAAVKLTGHGGSLSEAMNGLLKDPSIHSKPKNEIEEMKEFKDFEKNFTEFLSTAKKYRDYAKVSLEIAGNLGLSDQDMKNAQKGIEVLDVAISAGVAVVSSNPMDYLQAASAVTGFFARKNKPDPAAERHKQVMEAFSQVFKNQKQILDNQGKIYELQIDTYKLVDNLYQLNKAYLFKIDHDINIVLANQAALLNSIISFSNISSNLTYCEKFLNSRIDCNISHLQKDGDLEMCYQEAVNSSSDFIPDIVDFHTTIMGGYFSEFDSYTGHFNSNNNASNFEVCESTLKIIFNNNTHKIFYSSSHIEKNTYKTQIEEFIKDGYFGVLEILKPYYFEKDANSINSLYANLLYPVKRNEDFLIKNNAIIERYRKSDKVKLSRKQLLSLFKNILFVPAIERYTAYLIELSQYDGLVKDGAFINPEEIDLTTGSSYDLILQFHQAVKLINIAIAQQSFISGDGYLHIIKQILESGDVNNGRKIILAFKKNSYLRTNFADYYLKEKLSHYYNNDVYRDHTSNFKYNLEMYSDSDFLNSLMVGNISINEKSFKISIDDQHTIEFPLPSKDRVMNGMIVYSPELQRLLRLRERLYLTIFQHDLEKLAILENLYTVQ